MNRLSIIASGAVIALAFGGGWFSAKQKYDVSPDSSKWIKIDELLDPKTSFNADWKDKTKPSINRMGAIALNKDGTLTFINWDWSLTPSFSWDDFARQSVEAYIEELKRREALIPICKPSEISEKE